MHDLRYTTGPKLALALWLALGQGCILPEVWETEPDASTASAQVAQQASNPGETASAPVSPEQSAVGSSDAAATPADPASAAAATPADAAMPPMSNGSQTANGVGSAGATASAGQSSGAAGSGAVAPPTQAIAGNCGAGNTNLPAMLDTKGPWTPLHVENTGPTGESWIFYPDALGQNGLKHPVFEWGPGAGTGPDYYLDHLNLVASQGFVAISQASTISGKQALDWILAENDKPGSMWYQKLDPKRVGRGGHSMGALQAMSEADDPRLTLYVLACGGDNGTGGAANIHAPTIFLGGEGEGGTVNFEADYAAIQSAPTWFVTKTNTDHISCARNNLAPWIAFMRMVWCGDVHQPDLSGQGTFCKAPWLACKSKNVK